MQNEEASLVVRDDQQTDRHGRRLHFYRVKVDVELRAFSYCKDMTNRQIVMARGFTFIESKLMLNKEVSFIFAWRQTTDYKNIFKTVIPVKLKMKECSLVIIQVFLVIYT